MMSRLRILATAFALFIGASSLAGCSFEPGEQTQLVGQECFSDDHCVSGAICVERRCQYEGVAVTPDAGADASDPDDASPSDVPDNDEVWSVDVDMDDGAVEDARPGL